MAEHITPTTSSTPTYERPTQIHRRTGLPKSSIYLLIESGKLPSLRAGRAILVPTGAVESFLEEETARQRGRLPVDLTEWSASA